MTLLLLLLLLLFCYCYYYYYYIIIIIIIVVVIIIIVIIIIYSWQGKHFQIILTICRTTLQSNSYHLFRVSDTWARKRDRDYWPW